MTAQSIPATGFVPSAEADQAPTTLPLRLQIDAGTYADQAQMRDQLFALADLSDADRKTISANAAALVRDIRGHSSPGLMEVFLAEYGLSTDEGVALMCLGKV